MGIFPVLGMDLVNAAFSLQYLDQDLNLEHLVRSEA
jgi:hypothetical protein